MRVATLSRADLGKPVRLDPAFFVGRALVRATMMSARHVRLEDLVASIHDGARLPAATSGIPMLRLNSVRPCELDLSGVNLVDGSAGKWVNVQATDIVFTRAAQPFRAAVVPRGAPAHLAVSSELTIIRPRPAVLPEYLAAIFCTATLARILRDIAYRGGSTALPRLRLADIGHLPIPLPPRSLQEDLGRRYREAADLTTSARAEIDQVASAIHTEIDHRVSLAGPPGSALEVRRSALDRWDAPFHRGRAQRKSLAASPVMRPLLEVSKPGSSSLRGLAEDEDVFVVQAGDVNEATFLVEGGEHCPFSDLSSRMRQRLEVGDVLLCTTGSGQQVAYVDETLGHGGQALLGSATFTTLRFDETPRFFAVTLAHPLVRQQLELLASGSVQRFVAKRDLDELLIPALGQVWRQDFELRLARAMQHRREALLARAALIQAADDYMREVSP